MCWQGPLVPSHFLQRTSMWFLEVLSESYTMLCLGEMLWYLWASSETRKISLGRDNAPRTPFPACRLASQLLPEFLCCQPQVVPQVNPKVPRGELLCLANHTHQYQSHPCSVTVLWVSRSTPNPRPTPRKALLCQAVKGWSCLILSLALTWQPRCPSTVRSLNSGILISTDVPLDHASLVITATANKALSWGHGLTVLVIIQNLLVFVSNISVTKQLFMMLLNSAWVLSLTKKAYQ